MQLLMIVRCLNRARCCREGFFGRTGSVRSWTKVRPLMVRKVRLPSVPERAWIGESGLNVTLAIIRGNELFNKNCSLFLGLIDAMPSVFFFRGMELVHIGIIAHYQVFRRLWHVVSDGFDGVIVDEFAGPYIIAYGTVCRTLLIQREGVPQVERVAFISLYHPVLVEHLPKKIKSCHKLYIMVYYADSYI